MLTFCWTKKEDDNEQHVYHCLLCFETKIKKTWQAHDSSSSFFVAKQKVKKNNDDKLRIYCNFFNNQTNTKNNDNEHIIFHCTCLL